MFLVSGSAPPPPPFTFGDQSLFLGMQRSWYEDSDGADGPRDGYTSKCKKKKKKKKKKKITVSYTNFNIMHMMSKNDDI